MGEALKSDGGYFFKAEPKRASNPQTRTLPNEQIELLQSPPEKIIADSENANYDEDRVLLQGDLWKRIARAYAIKTGDINEQVGVVNVLRSDLLIFTRFEREAELHWNNYPELAPYREAYNSDKPYPAIVLPNVTEPQTLIRPDHKPTEEEQRKKALESAVLKSQFRRLGITHPDAQAAYKHYLAGDIRAMTWAASRIQDKLDTDPALEPYRIRRANATIKANNQVSEPKLTEYIKDETVKHENKKAEKLKKMPFLIFESHQKPHPNKPLLQ